MPAPLATTETVAAAAEAIAARGERPTVARVRQELGGGSPNVILPLLTAWKDARRTGPQTPPPRPEEAASGEVAPVQALPEIGQALDGLSALILGTVNTLIDRERAKAASAQQAIQTAADRKVDLARAEADQRIAAVQAEAAARIDEARSEASELAEQLTDAEATAQAAMQRADEAEARASAAEARAAAAEAARQAADAERRQVADQAARQAEATTGRIEALTAERDQARQNLAACTAGADASRRELLIRVEAAEHQAEVLAAKLEAALTRAAEAPAQPVEQPDQPLADIIAEATPEPEPPKTGRRPRKARQTG